MKLNYFVVLFISFFINFYTFSEEIVNGKLLLTIEELSQYDGVKKNKIYVAVDGVIYDQTNVPAWKTGSHKTGKGGEDITQKIKDAPHKTSVLKKENEIGYLIKNISKKELSKFDGKNGRPLYIAVDGYVYDYTNVEAWKTGSHKTGKGGEDISKKILSSPHGKDVLKDKKIVGKLVD